LSRHLIISAARVIYGLNGLDAQVAGGIVAGTADIADAGLQDQAEARVLLALRAGDFMAHRLRGSLRAQHPRIGLEGTRHRFGQRLTEGGAAGGAQQAGERSQRGRRPQPAGARAAPFPDHRRLATCHRVRGCRPSTGYAGSE
jgi:hypothetical protein